MKHTDLDDYEAGDTVLVKAKVTNASKNIYGQVSVNLNGIDVWILPKNIAGVIERRPVAINDVVTIKGFLRQYTIVAMFDNGMATARVIGDDPPYYLTEKVSNMVRV